jgi:hypothetical protein
MAASDPVAWTGVGTAGVQPEIAKEALARPVSGANK